MNNISNQVNPILRNIAKKTTTQNDNNIIHSLSITDIDNIIQYLYQIRQDKYNKLMNCNNYINPYESGSRQNILPAINRDVFASPTTYQIDNNIKSDLQIDDDFLNDRYPGEIRNIGIESLLLQSASTKTPGQRRLFDRPIDRFQYLPFNPQNPEHIVWSDDMPRSGYATRTERLND